MDAMLEFLCCPVTGQTLRAATPEERNRFSPWLESALIREDLQVVYPVENGVPLLISTAAISLKREPSPQ